MAHSIQIGILFITLSLLNGCPVYSQGGCRVDEDCAPSYRCDRASSGCYLPEVKPQKCSKPEDCKSYETCNYSRNCVPGDCSFHDCVAGFVCSGANKTWRCEPVPGGAGGSAGKSGAAGTSGTAGKSTAGTAGMAGAL